MKPCVLIPLIAMVFFTALSPACTSSSAADPSPQGVLKTYIQNVNDRDTQEVHDALSSRLQSQYDRAYETTRQDPVHDALYGLELQGATIQIVTIINQTITGQNASVEVDYFWHYPGISRISEQRQIVEWVNEGGTWKLDTFFPFEGQNILSEATPISGEQSPVASFQINSPGSPYQESGQMTPSLTGNVTYSTVRLDAQGCPVILTHPPEVFACPRNLSPVPDGYRFQDPAHPTRAELDAIPVSFSGVDRTTLIASALNNSCVKEFLAAGGALEGISSSPHPTVKTTGEPWPPVLYAYHRINCTDLLVQFDINPVAENVSNIHIEFT